MTAKCVQIDAPWEHCCVCGKKVKTCERKRPVNGNNYVCPAHPNGCQLSDGRWTCSSECWDKAVDAGELEAKRLAAVRELVRTSIRRNGGHERDMEYAKALEALAAVWPEAVEVPNDHND